MKKEYKINIKTTSTVDGEINETNIFESCEFSYSEDKQIIIYNEPRENEMENVKTVVSAFTDKKIIIERIGSIEHNLKIEKDKTIANQYTTMHGIFVVNIKYVNIINSLTKDGGELFIHYEIMVEDNILSENQVYIHII